MDTQKLAPAATDSETRRKHSKLVQVVQNFFTKTLLVIVQARSVPEAKPLAHDGVASAESSGTSKINKWFNLHMPSLDSEWARLELKPWKSHADLSQFPPMIVETFLDLRQLSACEMVMLEDDHGSCWPVAEGGSKKLEVVLERWLIEFDRSSCGPDSVVDSSEELPLVYKQAIVLLRVIYGVVRLLPAYKAKKLVAKRANKNLALRNRFVDGKQPVNSKGRVGLSKSIVPHQMLTTESHMTQREFSPIHTSLGTLRVSVAYRNHHKFNAQDQEERLLNHFLLSDHERARGSQNLRARGSAESGSQTESVQQLRRKESTDEERAPGATRVLSHEADAKAPRGSFGQFREKYSVLPCTSEPQDIGNTSPRTTGKKPGLATILPLPANARPSIQPFKVGSIGSSSSPPYGTLASVQTSGRSSSMERRISITSNRSGSNASLVALLRNPRGSTSSSNTPNVNVGVGPNHQNHNLLLPRPISSAGGPHQDTNQESNPNTPRFSSSFGSRQSRRFSNTSARNAGGSNAESNAYVGTSVGLASSGVPFSGLYADDDISSFVQMIDGTSELRLSNSNHDSKLATPNNDGSTHFEALNRFQLLKSQYQHLSDSVSASLVLQHNQSRSPLDDKLVVRRSSQSTSSPAPSLPVGSYENSHLPSIVSRLSKLDSQRSQSSSENRPSSRADHTSSHAPHLVAPPLTVTTIAHATHALSPGSKEAVSGPATSPSAYNPSREDVKYENVFEEDDEGIDYFVSLRGNKHQSSQDHDMSFDNDDLLFEMTDTR
ncbi:hypothetical protein METBIDRAFT_40513 [Metschnikowia bicuspidata var. bicuspidata NRRL YB-4993]|uniref:Autophagy-related protein 13 n=1 Tax=Metschnikowia bicuspidata var. bicuspidata NRRL YB-4993 TaxID=869754 RepID=A0A1A0HDH3_9ASCO|nr:hypothetical protein METBIDRAFT_40513 [Metschnikowia bicuspidata var. bicuspidata NRRL YB-4993]OBA22025.1 hypothetical protein METBIDRAFT_40513 [Metschnikowia bicuspidata var. bicuspidata NRRL YB-4993]